VRRKTPDKFFGANLRLMREGRHLSQEELGFRAGIHRNYVGMLERGEKSPTLGVIFQIAKALDTRPFELIKRVEDAIAKGS
jgi:transcriptional regulator with XRE-family HTH domain